MGHVIISFPQYNSYVTVKPTYTFSQKHTVCAHLCKHKFDLFTSTPTISTEWWDEWMDEWMNGWLDGRTNRQT